jgi:putative transposase
VSAYIDSHRSRFGVEPICRVLGVAPSSDYAARGRPPSARALADAELVEEIHAARSGYRRVCGIRKTWRELGRRGVRVGRDRVGRLMRHEGLEGVRRGRRHRTTTPDERAAERARDLVERRFVADRPNRLEMAVALRDLDGRLVAHSDRGSQFTSLRYTDRLDELGIDPSVGSRGDAYDNAMAEAFVATFKAELVAGRRFASFEAAEHETLRWIAFYNAERLHEELGDVPPAEFEARVRRTPHGSFGAVEPDRPPLIGGAAVGLGGTVSAT